MAKENNYQNLAQVDYCIRQYFSKYMAPTLVKEVRNLREKQTEEFINRLEKNESEFADLAHVIFDQAKIADGQIPVDPAGYLKRVNALLLA